MSSENDFESQFVEQKSLRNITDKKNIKKLAEECVAFANARGGIFHIGIENGEPLPPEGQKIRNSLANTLHSQIKSNTVNVEPILDIITAENASQYIRMEVPRSLGVASTTRGEYRKRVGEESRPIVGDEIMHLAADRANLQWETLVTAQVPRAAVDKSKVKYVMSKLKSSNNAKESVKKKTAEQVLDHFKLAEGEFLTNLGILCVGKQKDRAKLGVSPIIQFIKKDEAGNKINKIVWDDYDLSPMELVDDVWKQVPDFRETYEVPNGMHRDLVPAFDEEIVRELLVNAIVHRPYTQKGDIYLHLNSNRLEIVNSGLLPNGVTPRNILYESMRRNDHLAKLFHDIGLMEREGSGFDRICDILLSQGRLAPELKEGDNSVIVTVRRMIPDQKVIKFVSSIQKSMQLSSNERIILGMLFKNGPITARGMATILGMGPVEELKEWMKRLLKKGIVTHDGKTQATQYYVAPDALSVAESGESSATLAARSQDDDIMTMVENDISQNPRSSIGEIHKRIGDVIPRHKLRRVLSSLVESGRIVTEGVKRGTRYTIP